MAVAEEGAECRSGSMAVLKAAACDADGISAAALLVDEDDDSGGFRRGREPLDVGRERYVKSGGSVTLQNTCCMV